MNASKRLPESGLITLDPGTHLSAWLGPDSGTVQTATLEHLASS